MCGKEVKHLLRSLFLFHAFCFGWIFFSDLPKTGYFQYDFWLVSFCVMFMIFVAMLD